MASIIEKPFEPSDLLGQVRGIIDNRAKNKDSGYDSRIINSFASAINDVFKFYFSEVPVMSGIRVKPVDQVSEGLISSMVSIEGSGFEGSTAMSVNGPFVRDLAKSAFPDMDIKLDQAMAVDLVGEASNQVLGKVKMNLAKLGLKTFIGIPKIIVGKQHTIIHMVSNPILILPFSLKDIKVTLEFCFSSRDLTFDSSDIEVQQESGKLLLFDE